MKVEISIHASKLKNVAGTFKGTSDPFAVVTHLACASAQSKPKVLGKTETVNNTLSPQWVKVFYVDYELGVPCKVAIHIFDEVEKKNNKSMGSAVFDIAELLGARGNTKAKKLKQGGTIFAVVRKAQAGAGILQLQLGGSKLKNVEDGFFSKSDPFFELSRKIASAGGLTWDNVYRSKHIPKSLDPTWEPSSIDVGLLCGGDLDAPIKISLFDHESSGKHKPMGSAELSIKSLQQNSGGTVKLTQKGKEVGTLKIIKAQVTGATATASSATTSSATAAATAAVTAGVAAATITQRPAPTGGAFVPPPVTSSSASSGLPNFIDYVSGGTELNVSVAIDFTGSNGDPRVPGTLHHLDAHSNNAYEKAISAIVGILSKYDSDQKFPVYGFGAKYGGEVRHCFQCGSAAEAHGVKGVLEAYHQVFSSGLIMSGPTVFTEVIETAAARAASNANKDAYTILLILTDGAVSDVAATARCLDAVSNSPLSVVIVGVGNADFSSMQFLDDCAAGKPGKRDIAQFVPFQKHAHNSVALTSETLHEIPQQVVQYFQAQGIAPHAPLQRSDSSIQVEDEEEIDLSLDFKGGGGEDEEIVVTGGGNGFVDGFNATRVGL